MRGEKCVEIFHRPLVQGSPPHARGKVPDKDGSDSAHGITPACAGKSFQGLQTVHLVRDHPRMRGEKLKEFKAATVDWGSPPHARGKVIDKYFRKGRMRITPACAGKRSGNA